MSGVHMIKKLKQIIGIQYVKSVAELNASMEVRLV